MCATPHATWLFTGGLKCAPGPHTLGYPLRVINGYSSLFIEAFEKKTMGGGGGIRASLDDKIPSMHLSLFPLYSFFSSIVGE